MTPELVAELVSACGDARDVGPYVLAVVRNTIQQSETAAEALASLNAATRGARVQQDGYRSYFQQRQKDGYRSYFQQRQKDGYRSYFQQRGDKRYG